MREFIPGRAAARKADIHTDIKADASLGRLIDEPTRIVCSALALAVIALAIRIVAIW